MRFEFATAGRIIFGVGAVRELGTLAKALGKRALIVTGRNQSRAEVIRRLLHEAGMETVVFSVSGEPEIETVQQGTALARREKCEVVIGFGGGSSLDAGKAIAAMLTNKGELMEYLEVIGQSRQLS